MGLDGIVQKLWGKAKNYALALSFVLFTSVAVVSPYLIKTKDWKTQVGELGKKVSSFCAYSNQKPKEEVLSKIEEKLFEEMGDEPVLIVCSPDGAKVAYTYRVSTDSGPGTEMVLDDGKEAKIIFSEPKEVVNLQWSKSSRLAFSTFGQYKHHIFKTDEDHLGDDVYVYDGNKLTNITKDSSADILVGWDANENLIIVSNRSGFGMTFDAYRVSANGDVLDQLSNNSQDKFYIALYANLLAGGLCLFLGAAAYSHARVYRKRLKYSRPVKSRSSLLEFLVSNAGLSAGFAGAYNFAINLSNMPCFATNPLIYSFLAQGSCLTCSTIYLLLNQFRVFKSPTIKNLFRYGRVKKPKNPEIRAKVASRSRDCLRFQEADEKYWLATAEIYASQNDFHKSLCSLQKAAKLANKYGIRSITKADWSAQIASAFLRRPYSNTPVDLLSSAFEQAFHSRIEKFEKYSSEALHLLEHEPLKLAEAKFCCANAYEFTGKHGKAKQFREEAVREILSLPNFNEFLVNIVSGHAVYELEFDDYTHFILAIKEGPEALLLDEARNLSHVAELIDKERRINCSGFGVVAPWGVYEHQNKHYLAEERALGNLLETALEKNFDAALLDLASRYQAFLHARMPQGRCRNHEEDLKSLLGETKIQPSLKQGVLDLCKALFPLYSRAGVFDCDGHRANRFVDEDGRIVGIDLESRGYIPTEFDLAKLLKQGPAADQLTEHELLESYVSIARRAKLDVDIQDLERRVLAASPYKAIRYALYVMDKPAHHPTARTFLFNAKNDLASLASSDAIPSDAARHGGEVFQKVESYCLGNANP